VNVMFVVLAGLSCGSWRDAIVNVSVSVSVSDFERGPGGRPGLVCGGFAAADTVDA